MTDTEERIVREAISRLRRFGRIYSKPARLDTSATMAAYETMQADVAGMLDALLKPKEDG